MTSCRKPRFTAADPDYFRQADLSVPSVTAEIAFPTSLRIRFELARQDETILCQMAESSQICILAASLQYSFVSKSVRI